MVLLALTVIAASFPLGPLSLVISLAIAGIKAAGRGVFHACPLCVASHVAVRRSGSSMALDFFTLTFGEYLGRRSFSRTFPAWTQEQPRRSAPFHRPLHRPDDLLTIYSLQSKLIHSPHPTAFRSAQTQQSFQCTSPEASKRPETKNCSRTPPLHSGPPVFPDLRRSALPASHRREFAPKSQPRSFFDSPFYCFRPGSHRQHDAASRA